MSTGGRHDRLFAHVVREGDSASELAERLTVEAFGHPPEFEREIVAFRKLRTDARVSAARSFLARKRSSAQQQDIRRIEDVTDDEIVDAIAECGIDGLDNEDPWEGNAFEQVCRDMHLINDDSDGDNITEAEMELSERIGALEEAGRLSNPRGDRIYLTAREWARRLAGLREDSIAAILSGEPQPDDDLTDDEIHRAAFGSS